MTRYFVTVKTPDGITLINRMMTECETVKEAVRAGKRAVIDGNRIRFDTPADIAPFMRSVEVRCETVADVALSPRQKPVSRPWGWAPVGTTHTYGPYETVKRGDGWDARLIDNHGHWERGRTEGEALGRLYIRLWHEQQNSEAVQS